MRRLHAGTNITLFLLFFGAALLDAMLSRHWLIVALWIVVAVMFLMGDVRNAKAEAVPPRQR